MRERIRRGLDAIVKDDALERSWLQTLSLLEFIGARKIGKTAAAHHPPRAVLDHWADETRHAAVFAALAEEGSRGDPQTYLCRDAAKAYFAELDGALSGWATGLVGGDDPLLSYLLVTTLIERRAMAIYPMYRAATRRLSVKEALGRILVEEQSHRVTIEERCRARLEGLAPDLFAAPLAMEDRLFSAFWDRVEQVLSQGAFAGSHALATAAVRPKGAARPG